MTTRPETATSSIAKRHPRVILIFLSCFACASLVLMTEKVLQERQEERDRLSPPRPDITRHTRLREHPVLSLTYRTPTHEYLVDTEGLVAREYKMEIDSQGYVSPSNIHAVADFSIVFLGGSTTECMYMDEMDRFPFLVGRILEHQTALRVNSINAGVSGNHSLHSINILLTKILPARPRVVCLMHNINDMGTLMLLGTYWNNNPGRSILIATDNRPPPPTLWAGIRTCARAIIPNLAWRAERLSERLFAAPSQTSADEWAHLRGSKVSFDRNVMAAEFSANLETFVAICRARRISPVLMTMANRLHPRPDPRIAGTLRKFERDFGVSYVDYKSVFDEFNQCIRTVASETHTPLIDLAARIPQDAENMYDVVHFTATGSRAAAAVIASDLTRLNLIQPATPGAGFR